MDIEHHAIAGLVLIRPKIFMDSRGSFCETYKHNLMFEAGIDNLFIQENRSYSTNKNTVRGLHFQTAPFAQAKLVSVQCGRIYDVAIDLRSSSPTFAQHVAFELSADGGEQFFIPAGFAHGFCTLEQHTVVTYKVDSYYAPQHERGLHWQSAELGIEWPCRAEEGILSPKDNILPDFIDFAECFP